MRYKLIEPKVKQDLRPAQRILTNRGIKLEDIYDYINITKDKLLNPSLLDNIDAGIDLLLKHIEAKNKIFFIIDGDFDGFASSALFINYLYMLYPDINLDYGFHAGKEHGIELKLVPEDIQLLVCIDSASNDYEQHKILKDKGIDILIIDHHQAEKVSEDACVINNQLCGYPNKTLCGAGVAYKVCERIDERFDIGNAEWFTDLAATALIADMMDLKDFETRYLVDYGLAHFNNPFLVELSDKNEYSISKGGGLNPFTVGFYIAPFVNAINRSGTIEEKRLVFESMLEHKAEEKIPSTKRGEQGLLETRVVQAVRTCLNVKNRQTKIVDEGLANIDYLLEEDKVLDNKIIVVKVKKDHAIDKSITGLVANKLMSQHKKPVLLLNQKDNEDGSVTWEGSARNPGDTEVKDLRQFVLDTNLVNYANGHASSFGTSIKDKNVNEFIEKTNKKLKDCDFSTILRVDLIWNAESFDYNDIFEISDLNYLWGQGLETPLIALEDIKVNSENVNLLKNNVLKISLPNGVNLIKFNSSENQYNSLAGQNNTYVKINIVGECQQNEWNGTITPQILIKDFEIISQKKWDF